jgi:hypothetical protein
VISIARLALPFSVFDSVTSSFFVFGSSFFAASVSGLTSSFFVTSVSGLTSSFFVTSVSSLSSPFFFFSSSFLGLSLDLSIAAAAASTPLAF